MTLTDGEAVGRRYQAPGPRLQRWRNSRLASRGHGGGRCQLPHRATRPPHEAHRTGHHSKRQWVGGAFRSRVTPKNQVSPDSLSGNKAQLPCSIMFGCQRALVTFPAIDLSASVQGCKHGNTACTPTDPCLPASQRSSADAAGTNQLLGYRNLAAKLTNCIGVACTPGEPGAGLIGSVATIEGARDEPHCPRTGRDPGQAGHARSGSALVAQSTAAEVGHSDPSRLFRMKYSGNNLSYEQHRR
jgi:hypothetical protein